MLGSIAEKLGRRFAPFLPHAVEAALASCAQASSAPACLLHAFLASHNQCTPEDAPPPSQYWVDR